MPGNVSHSNAHVDNTQLVNILGYKDFFSSSKESIGLGLEVFEGLIVLG